MLLVSIFLIHLSTALSLANSTFQEKILAIHGGKKDEDALIFYSSGKVVHLPAAKKFLISEIKNKLFNENIKYENLFYSNGLASSYSPSILKNIDEAKALFSEARSGHDEKSQCYNRAHVWTYEWRIKKNIFSSKTWLFFTPKFIRKYKFDWWFHVAPMLHVITNDEVKERIMDMKYAKGPLKLKDWTDIFMRDRADCPVVDKYTEYSNYPESGSCFVIKSSMYYYWPLDLEQEELNGVTKESWIESEVTNAYLDGFNIVI